MERSARSPLVAQRMHGFRPGVQICRRAAYPERHNQSDLAGLSGLSGLSGRGRWQLQRDADTLLPAERLDARCGQPGLEARGQHILVEFRPAGQRSLLDECPSATQRDGVKEARVTDGP
jgi:hypothetical protein